MNYEYIDRQAEKQTERNTDRQTDSLNSKFTKLSIVLVYAPTEDAKEESKEGFYDSLKATVGKITTCSSSWVTSMRELAVTTATVKAFSLRNHGVGAMNDNGERLCDFCETSRLTIREVPSSSTERFINSRGIPRWKNRETDRSYYHQQQMEMITCSNSEAETKKSQNR